MCFGWLRLYSYRIATWKSATNRLMSMLRAGRALGGAWTRHRSTRVLCSELEVGASRELTVDVPVPEGAPRSLEVLVVRSPEDGVTRAYENHCPHAGGPLNLFPDVFIAPDGRHLICTRHAARFTFDSGKCVDGPCVGKSLNPLATSVCAETGALQTTEAELQRLVVEGGSAVIKRRRELRRARKRAAATASAESGGSGTEPRATTTASEPGEYSRAVISSGTRL